MSLNHGIATKPEIGKSPIVMLEIDKVLMRIVELGYDAFKNDKQWKPRNPEPCNPNYCLNRSD